MSKRLIIRFGERGTKAFKKLMQESEIYTPNEMAKRVFKLYICLWVWISNDGKIILVDKEGNQEELKL